MRQPWHDADPAAPTRPDRDRERAGHAPHPATHADEEDAGDTGDATLDTEALATGGEHHGLAPGTQLHRYVILGPIGSGGMGAVYRAHDPRLERDIAIKLVHVRDGNRSARTRHRLLREAQALAQLSHPNVVAVHDVGEFEGSIFIAMELVVGQTVRQWLRQAPRDLAAILDVFLAVGSGLDAAHRAGLVHRDIKPDNLIIGEDGRVRILDFGLARIAMDASSDSVSGRRSAVMPAAVHEATTAVGFLAAMTEDEPDGDHEPEANDGGAAGPAAAARALDTPLTRTGAILGTPAYMAPEQIQSGAVDARTDQFAFCVCLYEALYGARPFAGTSIETLFAAVLDGRLVEPPASRRVPGWLRAALVRGLEVDPGRRWPTMHALLGALRRGRERRKQRWLAVAAGLLALSAAAAIAGYHSARTDVCSGAGEHLRGVWDEDRRAILAGAFRASGAPYAAESLTRLTQIFDRYAGAWTAAHVDACQDTAVRQEQSIELLDQRMECLAGRRRALGELVSVLSQGDATTLQNSLRAAAGLPRIEACADVEYVRSSVKPPEDPAVAARVTSLRDKLARAHQLDVIGDYEKGLALMAEIQTEAARIDYRPLQIEIDARLGSLQDRQGAFADARTNLERAFFAAQEIQYTRAALEAATLLTWVVGYSQAKPEAGHAWARHAEALLGRGGGEEERAALLSMQGMVYNVEGQAKRAEECHRKALAIREQVLGPEHPDVGHALNNLGMALLGQSRPAEARVIFERALALGQATLGPEHPAIAQFLGNIGIALSEQGDYTQAETYHRKALAIREKMLPPDHPEIARSLDMLATESFYLGKYAEAEDSYRKALAIREKVLGPDHPQVASTINALGSALEGQRRIVEAEALYRRGLALREKALGPEHLDVANSLTNLGIVVSKLGHYAEAETYYSRALAIREKALGPDDTEVAISLGSMGDVSLRQGKYEEAERRYLRALAIREKVQGPEHPNIVWALLEVAHSQSLLGKRTEARAALRRALAISEKAQGENRGGAAWAYLGLAFSHASAGERAEARKLYDQALALWQASSYESHDSVWALVGLAELDIDDGKLASAEQRCRRALAILEKSGNPNDPDLSYALVCLAEVSLGRKQGAEALALAERAVKLQEAEVANLLSLASARFAYARALVATGGDRAEARALAGQALAAYQATGDRDRKEMAEIQAWLARQPGP